MIEKKINMKQTLQQTDFSFPGQSRLYKGKVRDVYEINDKLMVMVATDRISAFDVVLPRGIPYKGQVLNKIAEKFMKKTEHILPNWIIDSPHPNATIGIKCKPFKVEMVIRGYLSGHAWREYREGRRLICGVKMPDGMRENDVFPTPLITPSTKADTGHDEDIAPADIISRGLVNKEDFDCLVEYTKKLFSFGTKEAAGKGLILVDTKYEFGKDENGTITLIDEIHTPDSSRYFYSEGYEEKQNRREKQKQLSKEFVREWLIANGFQGLEGQQIPTMTDDFVESVSNRYIELYEMLTGEKFYKKDYQSIVEELERKVLDCLSKLN